MLGRGDVTKGMGPRHTSQDTTLTVLRCAPMIHDEVAMPIPVSETAVRANSSAVKIAIATVIALGIGVLF